SELKKELQFNTELVQLIETLKNIAAAQYHLMEKKKERFYEFMEAFSGFFRMVKFADIDNPLVRLESDVSCIVAVTSDAGFMGGLTQGIVREATKCQGDRSDESTRLVVIGDKGATQLSDRRTDFKFFAGVNQETIYEQALEVKDYLVKEVLARRIGKVTVVYARPLSFSAQTTEGVDLLPCAELFEGEHPSDEGRRGTLRERLLGPARSVIVESSVDRTAEYLAEMWVTSKLYEIFEDSKLAEFSARAMHLEGSLQKLEKEQKKLKHMWFKSAHEKIDKGMRESFSATKAKRGRGARAA
ncbi:F0F1 ATP synthase subunit gamma, partial [Verrucomicrobiota bacterium]